MAILEFAENWRLRSPSSLVLPEPVHFAGYRPANFRCWEFYFRAPARQRKLNPITTYTEIRYMNLEEESEQQLRGYLGVLLKSGDRGSLLRGFRSDPRICKPAKLSEKGSIAMKRDNRTADSGCWWICLHPSSSCTLTEAQLGHHLHRYLLQQLREGGNRVAAMVILEFAQKWISRLCFSLDLRICRVSASELWVLMNLSQTSGSCRYLIYPGLSWCRLCLMWSIYVSLVSWFLPSDCVVCGLMYVAVSRALLNPHVIKSRRNVTSSFISKVEMQQQYEDHETIFLLSDQIDPRGSEPGKKNYRLVESTYSSLTLQASF